MKLFKIEPSTWKLTFNMKLFYFVNENYVRLKLFKMTPDFQSEYLKIVSSKDFATKIDLNDMKFEGSIFFSTRC